MWVVYVYLPFLFVPLALTSVPIATYTSDAVIWKNDLKWAGKIIDILRHIQFFLFWPRSALDDTYSNLCRNTGHFHIASTKFHSFIFRYFTGGRVPMDRPAFVSVTTDWIEILIPSYLHILVTSLTATGILVSLVVIFLMSMFSLRQM